MKYTIEVKNLSKKYSKKPDENKFKQSLVFIKDFLGKKSQELLGVDEFWAFKNINFSLKIKPDP